MPIELSSNLAVYLNASTASIKQLPPGFNAQAAIFNETAFVRELKPDQILGGAAPADQLFSLIESINPIPHSLSATVLIDNGTEVVNVPEIKQVVTVGAVLPDDAVNLLQFIELDRKSEHPDELASELEPTAMSAVDALVEIHKYRADEISGMDSGNKSVHYMRGTGAILANRDLTFGVLDFVRDQKSWIAQYSTNYFNLMMKARETLGEHPERLATIHGDYWWANLYQTADHGMIVTDTRIGLGEPAGDLTALVSELLLKDLIEYGQFGGPFTQLAKRMIARYKELSGDEDVEKYMGLNYGFKTLAEASLSLQSGNFSREILATGVGVLLNTIDGQPFYLDGLNESFQRGLKELDNWEKSDK